MENNNDLEETNVAAEMLVPKIVRVLNRSQVTYPSGKAALVTILVESTAKELFEGDLYKSALALSDDFEQVAAIIRERRIVN
jgi:hypothetical protein